MAHATLEFDCQHSPRGAFPVSGWSLAEAPARRRQTKSAFRIECHDAADCARSKSPHLPHPTYPSPMSLTPMNSSNLAAGLTRHLSCLLVCLSFGVSPSWAQLTASAPPDPAQLAKYDKDKNGVLDADENRAMEANAATVPPGDEVLELSPFEVIADTKGYLASNTMSGTRLNAKIEDLGASITVITKQQLIDTVLEINDQFVKSNRSAPDSVSASSASWR